METVTVSKKVYDALVKDQAFLRRLEGAGVDNWEGYSFACVGDGEEESEEDIYGK